MSDETPDTTPHPTGDVPDPTRLPLPDGQLTDEEAAVMTKVLFQPTVERMALLTRSLIEHTQSLDHLVWAPLATLEGFLIEIAREPPATPETQRLVTLAQVALNMMSEHITRFRTHAWTDFEPWTTAETAECYRIVGEYLSCQTQEDADVVDPTPTT